MCESTRAFYIQQDFVRFRRRKYGLILTLIGLLSQDAKYE